MSGGTPCGTPGTPCGKTGWRGPCSGVFDVPRISSSESLSSGSNPLSESQPASANAKTRAAAVTTRFIACSPSGLRLVVRQGRQHVHSRARAGRCLGVGRNQVQPALRRSRVVVAPSRKREQLARGVAERTIRGGQRLELRGEFGEGRGIDQDQPFANRREIAQRAVEAGVCGERRIELRGAGRAGFRELGGLAGVGGDGIARASVLRDLGEGGLSLSLLAVFGELDRGLELR